MDFRDWIIVVGGIVIVGILLDGYRRMRLARMDSLKMSKNMGGEIDTSPLDDDYNPELPGGGGRVVARNEPQLGEDIDDFNDELGTTHEPSVGEPDLNSDSTNTELNVGVDHISARSSDDVPEFQLEQEVEEIPWRTKRFEASKSTTSSNSPEPVNSPVEVNSLDQVSSSEQNYEPEPSDRASNKGGRNKKDSAKSTKPEPTLNTDYEVIVINVDAKPDQIFHGADIKRLLEACGLEHGDMSIFHRHEEDDLLSPVQFSVANAVEPGYFDPAQMSQLSTPGVSFFMSMPGPKDYMQAFDFMLETAQCFAKNLHGELRDERRSVMTKQTIEHCRQRVRDYERKQLSRAAH